MVDTNKYRGELWTGAAEGRCGWYLPPLTMLDHTCLGLYKSGLGQVFGIKNCRALTYKSDELFIVESILQSLESHLNLSCIMNTAVQCAC